MPRSKSFLSRHRLAVAGVRDPNAAGRDPAVRQQPCGRNGGAANFTTGYDDQTYLILIGSQSRRHLLDALIEDDPQSDLIPKLVTGLLAHHTRGRWGSTQENVFVLLAMEDISTPTNRRRPILWRASGWANLRRQHELRGRTTERHETHPDESTLSEPAAGGGPKFDPQQGGPGRLYYAWVNYAPPA